MKILGLRKAIAFILTAAALLVFKHQPQAQTSHYVLLTLSHSTTDAAWLADKSTHFKVTGNRDFASSKRSAA